MKGKTISLKNGSKCLAIINNVRGKIERNLKDVNEFLIRQENKEMSIFLRSKTNWKKNQRDNLKNLFNFIFPASICYLPFKFL